MDASTVNEEEDFTPLPMTHLDDVITVEIKVRDVNETPVRAEGD